MKIFMDYVNCNLALLFLENSPAGKIIPTISLHFHIYSPLRTIHSRLQSASLSSAQSEDESEKNIFSHFLAPICSCKKCRQLSTIIFWLQGPSTFLHSNYLYARTSVSTIYCSFTRCISFSKQNKSKRGTKFS